MEIMDALQGVIVSVQAVTMKIVAVSIFVCAAWFLLRSAIRS